MARIIANYLPQFHETKENNIWWGKGYTDWTAVKRAKPLFRGHDQPKRPLDDYYYDLSNSESIKWQVDLAKKYGIYGFGIYHYWFDNDNVMLRKPSEQLLKMADLDIHYMFIWDNASWRRTWSNIKDCSNDWAPQFDNKALPDQDGYLIKLEYGDENRWKEHFDYLLQYFKDERYIKIDGKPVFGVFNQTNHPEVLKRMIDFWEKMAIKAGFDGIEVIGRYNNQNCKVTAKEFYYEPIWSGWIPNTVVKKISNKVKVFLQEKLNIPMKYNYDLVWKRILHNARKSERDVYLSGFVSYDDSPRRGMKGKVVVGASPRKFEIYLRKLLRISEAQNKEYVFLTAWNEWGEGAYLEPDYKGYDYLEAIRNVVNEKKNIDKSI
ncbi:glycoside hydrolase family 99-like domain-containing protein [Butyrivibrio sp. NC2002]|uniref:glycoside hydrolase family 99-like domain-containing protein n=1 Tax=Butyrivibrio sp. NC2002 TaxID=1410610 RepID=UPI00056A9BCE|nr:glycoside hydrolase family 99-like domain-containing protein [Butyrivibrio sp. NC2002]